MSVYVQDTSKEFETAPEGLYPAVCCDVIDLGVQQTPWGAKHQVSIRWALEECDSRGKQFLVQRRYTASLNEKAALRQHLELWRGKKFTAAELKQFDLEVLLGKGCQVQIVHKILDDGRTFANVQAVIQLGRGVPVPPVPATYVREQDRAKAPEREDYSNQGTEEEDDDDMPF